jgi:protein gp37
MGRETGISWTDSTWNPIRGCSRVSEGCRHCYAETVANRFCRPGSPYDGVVQIDANGKGTGKWNGQIKFVEKHLLDPLRWKKPSRIFVNSMSDLFHENCTDEMRDQIFAVMALCPQHTFQVLTKRPERMLAYLSGHGNSHRRNIPVYNAAVEICAGDFSRMSQEMGRHRSSGEGWWPLPNVHLGVSVESQATADERIPLLLQTPAAVRFISAEPLLGPITFRWAKWDSWGPLHPHFETAECIERDGRLIRRITDEHDGLRMLDWVIVGGESGPGARPMHPDWARSLRDQCKAAGVPFFFKQWGEWLPPMTDGAYLDGSQHLNCSDESVRVGTKAAGCLLDGVEHHEFPA